MCHRPGTWLSTNYQPPEVLPNSRALQILGFFLDVLMALRPFTAFLDWPTIELSSILTDFWRIGELSGLGDQATLLPMDPQFQPTPAQSPTLPQACLWQPHPFKDLSVWCLVLLTAYKGGREARGRGLLRLEHGCECISWSDDGTRSHIPTACG